MRRGLGRRLLRLHELTTRDSYRQRAERTLKYFNRMLSSSLSVMMLALDYWLDTPKEVVIVSKRSNAEAEPLLASLRGVFLPNRIPRSDDPARGNERGEQFAKDLFVLARRAIGWRLVKGGDAAGE